MFHLHVFCIQESVSKNVSFVWSCPMDWFCLGLQVVHRVPVFKVCCLACSENLEFHCNVSPFRSSRFCESETSTFARCFQSNGEWSALAWLKEQTEMQEICSSSRYLLTRYNLIIQSYTYITKITTYNMIFDISQCYRTDVESQQGRSWLWSYVCAGIDPKRLLKTMHQVILAFTSKS